MTTLTDTLTLPCGVIIKNRIAKGAMTEGLSDSANRATSKLSTLYGRWADGGSGMLLTGNVQINHKYLERAGNVVIEGPQSDEQLAALKHWAAQGTTNDTQLWMQISHAGRQTPIAVNETPVGPSDLPVNMPGKMFGDPKAMTEAEIQAAIDGFAFAAKTAKETGFTGVQIHGAHGYLISEFLSPDVNVRTDAWGGSLENRARFLLEAVRASRKAVGNEFPVAVKLNSADFQRGGFSHEEAVQVAKWLNDEKLDLLEISGGTYEQPRMSGLEGGAMDSSKSESRLPSTVAREAYFLEYAKDIRAVFDGALMVTGGFRTRAGMNAALNAGACDMIGLARPMCSDPDIANKLLSGTVDATPEFEKTVRLGPGLLGDTSPFAIIRGINGWGRQGWFCLQLIRMGEGQEPDLKMGVLKAVGGFQAFEKKAAERYKENYGY